MNRRRLASLAIRALDDFMARRLWQRLDGDQPIALRLADGTELAVSILGAEGEDFGAWILLGAGGAKELLALAAGETTAAELESTLMFVHLMPEHQVPKEFRPWLEQARRQGKVLPAVTIADGVSQARPLTAAELRLAGLACRALTKADAAGMLNPGRPADTGRLLLLKVTGELPNPEVEVELVAAPVAEPEPEVAPAAEVPPELQGLGRSTQRLGLHLVELPIPERLVPEGLEPYAPGSMEALMMVDLATEKMDLKPVESPRPSESETSGAAMDDLCREAGRMLFTLLRDGGRVTSKGLPLRVVFAHRRLYRMVAPDLLAAGVECGFDPRDPGILTALEDTQEFAAERLEGNGDRGEPRAGSGPDFDPDRVPAAGDLAGWKAVDLAAIRYLVARCGSAGASQKALRRYLGPDADVGELAEAYGDMLHEAYMNWFLHDYRVERTARTQLERARYSHPPTAIRAVLEAMEDAVVSVYRVAGVQLGETLELQNILGGERIVIHDRSLSMTARVGIGLVLRVYRLGDFHVSSLMGPALPSYGIDRMLDELEDSLPLDLSGAGIPQEQRHYLGRLWEMARSGVATPREFQNTDGDQLEQVTAEFAVGDPEPLLRFLAERSEVEEDEPGCEWTWLEGDYVHAGLELIGGDRLLVETNSVQRMDRMQAHLETVPGVVLASRTARPLAPFQQGPTDDALPKQGRVPSSPALSTNDLEAVQEMLNTKYMAWLDESLPILQGKTPREACATEAGRRKVRQLIHSYADPAGIPGIKVPRERMLAELGLD